MRRILLALDGTEQSMATVDYVSGITPPEDTELTLYHVFSRIPEAFWDLEQRSGFDLWMEKLKTMEVDHEQAVREFMDRALERLVKAGFRPENLHLKIQDRIKGIARDIVAEGKNGYEALVMGSIGAGKFGNLTVGSVTAKVLGALTTVDTCVVSGKPVNGKCLVAFDGSGGSIKAVDFLGKIIKKGSHEITIFHAMRTMRYTGFIGGESSPLSEVEKKLWEEDRRMMEPLFYEAKSRLVRAGFPEHKIRVKVVTGVASRAGALLEEAKTGGFGSIFVGRTGVSETGEFNIGRVTNKVINRAENMAIWVAV